MKLPKVDIKYQGVVEARSTHPFKMQFEIMIIIVSFFLFFLFSSPSSLLRSSVDRSFVRPASALNNRPRLIAGITVRRFRGYLWLIFLLKNNTSLRMIIVWRRTFSFVFFHQELLTSDLVVVVRLLGCKSTEADEY